MKKIFLVIFLSIIGLLYASPVRSEMEKLTNTNWQEVPNTYTESPAAPEYNGSVFVDVNNIQFQGKNATVDIVDRDYSYYRLEINCQTKQIRSLRMGTFSDNSTPQESTVDFSRMQDAWRQPEEVEDSLLINFVCNLNS